VCAYISLADSSALKRREMKDLGSVSLFEMSFLWDEVDSMYVSGRIAEVNVSSDDPGETGLVLSMGRNRVQHERRKAVMVVGGHSV
jgi:hypothetical protein